MSLRLPDFKTIDIYEGGQVVSRTHRSSLPPREYSWYSFLFEAESTPRPECGRKDYVNEKPIGDQARDRLRCSAVPQPTAPPRGPVSQI